MDIKKANVNLLLGKIGIYLNSASRLEAKKGKRFIEAEKALDKLRGSFLPDKDGEIRAKSLPR